MAQYSDSIFIITLLLCMIVLQAIIASVAHRKQTQYIPGIVDDKLDHFSFVFRSHRTFMNSLENVPVFILTALMGMVAGIDSATLYWTVVVYAVARLIHMLLFYKIATNDNPSPRSYFYAIGLFAQIYLLYAVLAV